MLRHQLLAQLAHPRLIFELHNEQHVDPFAFEMSDREPFRNAKWLSVTNFIARAFLGREPSAAPGRRSVCRLRSPGRASRPSGTPPAARRRSTISDFEPVARR